MPTKKVAKKKVAKKKKKKKVAKKKATKKKTSKKKTRKAKRKEPVPPHFSRADFDSFYMGSMVVNYFQSMRLNEIKSVVEEFEIMAKKLIKACHIAAHGELIHAPNSDNDEALIKLFGTSEVFFEKLKYNELSFAQCADLFRNLNWACSFGGEPWAVICDEAAKLEQMLPCFENNARAIMIQVDHVIDLEHNTCLFMQSYCDFDMMNYLDDKSFDMVPEDFVEASSRMKTLVGKYVDDLTKA